MPINARAGSRGKAPAPRLNTRASRVLGFANPDRWRGFRESSVLIQRRHRNNTAPLPLGAQGRTMSIIQVEKRGTNVSVTFKLQTTREAMGLVEVLVRQLKNGELHLRLGSNPRLVIDVPQDRVA
jgi:hypothetical protein